MIPDSGTLPPEPAVCLFASEALGKRTWALLEEIPGVRENKDPECLHRMRVASRRFRNAFSLFPGCFPASEAKRWEKEARRVGRALGEARDADVQADSIAGWLAGLEDSRLKPGIERLLLRLSQKREKLQEKVLEALDRLERGPLKSELPEALRGLSVEMRLACQAEAGPVVRDVALRMLTRRLAELEAFDSVAGHPERVEELHAMRIAGKRLRYTLEVFRPLLGGEAALFLEKLKEMQDLLGEIHDCDVWTAWLPVFLEKEKCRTLRHFGHGRVFARLRPGILFLQEAYRARREERFEAFRAFWEKSRKAPGWAGLLAGLGRNLP